MTESIKELRKICQKEDYRKKGNLIARYITRDAALYITKFILPTGITANQVVVIVIALGIISGFAFMSGAYFMSFAGAVIFQLWYLFDHVDGQVARYRKVVDLTGAFYDFYGHYIVHFFILGGIAIGLYVRYSSMGVLLSGFLAAFSVNMISLLHDCEYKAYYHALSREEDDVTARVRLSGTGKNEKQSFLKTLFSLMHKFCEIHVIMNFVTAAAILDLFSRSNWLLAEMIMLSAAASAVWITGFVYIIKNRQIDKNYKNIFRRK